jgi:hypothetical protein
MKRAIVILVAVLAFSNAYANDEKRSIDEKLIKEVKAEMEHPIFFIDEIGQEPLILIYSIEGKLLHSFSRENIDPVAMRNVDLLMETRNQKIFVKDTELNPTI